jgi:hypothetical protein
MNWKGFERKWSWPNRCVFWRVWGRPQQTSARIDSMPPPCEDKRRGLLLNQPVGCQWTRFLQVSPCKLQHHKFFTELLGGRGWGGGDMSPRCWLPFLGEWTYYHKIWPRSCKLYGHPLLQYMAHHMGTILKWIQMHFCERKRKRRNVLKSTNRNLGWCIKLKGLKLKYLMRFIYFELSNEILYESVGAHHIISILLSWILMPVP